MTNETVLSEIPFSVDVNTLAVKLHLKEQGGYLNELERLVREAQAIARPKAMYQAAFVERQGEDFVVVDNVTLTSRVLRVNLEYVYRVFPYIATCGVELAEWADSLDDVLQQYWAEAIQEMALRQALKTMNEHLVERFEPGRTSTMNPGSLQDWPIQEQQNLFTLLGDPAKAIAVRLTDSFLMIPTKTISGLRFPTETRFESCQLCPRKECPGRRAQYDKNLYDTKYRTKVIM